MKTKMLFLNLLLIISSTTHADQSATLTCTGEKIKLIEKSPYLGEDSKATQHLFMLQAKGLVNDESRDTAYFLEIFEEGAASRTIYTGKNEVGGFFQLDVSAFEEVGDGTVINEVATGSLDYNHGPLRGKRETVKCVRN